MKQRALRHFKKCLEILKKQTFNGLKNRFDRENTSAKVSATCGGVNWTTQPPFRPFPDLSSNEIQEIIKLIDFLS